MNGIGIRGRCELVDEAFEGEGDLRAVRIAQVALKIALGRAPVDNMMKGNGVAPVDIASGVVGPGYVMDMSQPLILPRRLDIHPKTGSRIEGQQLPLWQETVDVVKRAAACFHPNSVLAWDVAITDRGPMIIEESDSTTIAFAGDEVVADPSGVLILNVGEVE